MRRCIPVGIALALLAGAGSALANRYKGGGAGDVSRPAYLVRRLHPEAEWARVTGTNGDMHTVTWRVRGTGEIRRTTISKAGVEGVTENLTTAGGKIIRTTRSGKGLIVEVSDNAGQVTHVRASIGGKWKRQTAFPPRKLHERWAYEVWQHAGTGTPEGDWEAARRRLVYGNAEQ